MSVININGSVASTNLQIGDNNNLSVGNQISKYHEELLNLFEEYGSSQIEKKELSDSLEIIESDQIEKPKAAEKIYQFLTSIAGSVASSAIFEILKASFAT